MNALWENPLAQMYGPRFLIVFATVAAIVTLVSRWRISRADSRPEMESLPVPDELDAYQVAYLRGGAKEAGRLALLSLFQRGYVEVTRKRSATGERLDLEESSNHAPSSLLSGVERIAFDGVAESGAGFQEGASSLTDAVENHYEPLKARLVESGLLASPQSQAVALRARWVGCALLLGLAVYKLTAALLNGRHNVGFLLILLTITLLILWAITEPARLSARGKKYLDSLSDRFGPEASRLELTGPAHQPETLLLVGIFGLGLLEHTGYSMIGQVFKEEEAAARNCCVGGAGGCGGGCGGGGCGGGCGGCGG